MFTLLYYWYHIFFIFFCFSRRISINIMLGALSASSTRVKIKLPKYIQRRGQRNLMIKLNRIVLVVFLTFTFVNWSLKKHQSECLFKVVKCPNAGCAKMLCKRDLKTHETLECSWRKVNCEYCEESVIMNQKQVWNKFIHYTFTTWNSVILNAPLSRS